MGLRTASVLAAALGILTNGHAQTSVDPALTDAVRTFEAAMVEKNAAAVLEFWDFETAADRAEEEAALAQVFTARQLTLTSGPPARADGGQTAAILSTLALISEPLGVVEQWGFV